MAEVPQTDELVDVPEGEYADPRDARIPRDGDGERIPQDAYIDDLGPALILPLNYGDVQRYFGDGMQHDVPPEELAKVIDRFVVEPDFADDADALAEETGERPRGRVTGDYVEDLYPLMIRNIIMAMFSVSRIDADVMMEGSTAQVTVQGN